jgi:undecaprenyl-diphosphatase
VNQFELGILDALHGLWQSPFLDRIMPLISSLSDHGEIWIVVALLFLLFARYRKAGITLALALIGEFIIVSRIIKPLVARPRPFMVNPSYQLLIAPLSDGSFPSGHSALSFAAAYVISHFNRTWGIAAYVLATLIALSRLYLYVHFPLDVVGGALIGTLIGMLAVWLIDRAEERWFPGRFADSSKRPADAEIERVE